MARPGVNQLVVASAPARELVKLTAFTLPPNGNPQASPKRVSCEMCENVIALAVRAESLWERYQASTSNLI